MLISFQCVTFSKDCENMSRSKLLFSFVLVLQKLALDIGCGTGQSTRILSPFFGRVLGTDISRAQIQNARKESVHNILGTELVMPSL